MYVDGNMFELYNMDKNKIIQISLNELGAYIIYSIPKVARGLHGKNKGHVDELLIVGIPNSKLDQWCNNQNIYITDKAVRDAYTDEIILKRTDDTYTYRKE